MHDQGEGNSLTQSSSIMPAREEKSHRLAGSKSSNLISLAMKSAILLSLMLAAAADYPCRDSYRTWPGPNSNTFISFILRSVPELGVDLPPNAIGRDFLLIGRVGMRAS